jgi:hypothetical protein
MSATHILAAYRVIFSALIVVASLQTLAAHPAHQVVLLAAVEIAGALMLAWRRAQWVGGAVLLAVFACAQIMSALDGEYPTRFLQYTASAVFIVALDRAIGGSRGVAR